MKPIAPPHKPLLGSILMALAAKLGHMPGMGKWSRYDKRVHAYRSSRYMPHQGKREMARRRAQMAKAEALS